MLITFVIHNGTLKYSLWGNLTFLYLFKISFFTPACIDACVSSIEHTVLVLVFHPCSDKGLESTIAGVYISFETHIFAPPPFFRMIFFPLTHGLKTGVFDRFLMPAQTSKKIFGF